MSLSRRVMIGVVALAALGIGVALLVPRFRARPNDAAPSGATDGRSKSADGGTIPRTSEELIAEALRKGDITYEESLLQRAYALFDDPRLEPLFRSPVINWHAAVALLHEINDKQKTLSAGVLDELTPFRVRPADPRSIFNRPRANVLPVQNMRPPDGWASYMVPGTSVKLWMVGTEEVLSKQYSPRVREIWSVFDKYFPYPTGDVADAPGPTSFNPDEAIDVYLLSPSTLDPRRRDCVANPALTKCALELEGNIGLTPDVDGSVDRKSGYVMVDVELPPDWLQSTIAHELAHVTQHNYDASEALIGGIGEGTATWVEYKVMKALPNKVPDLAYNLLDPAQSGNALFAKFDIPLNHSANSYRSWLFYLYASMEMGDDVVTRIWERAAQTGFDGFNAVDQVVPFIKHFPAFAVRNWNIDIPNRYKTSDGGFRPQTRPVVVHDMPTAAAEIPLDDPLDELSARYYHFKSFDANVRRVTLLNLDDDQPNAHVWAIKKIGATWKDPEDWSTGNHVLCRDIPDEDVSELVLVASNSHMTNAIDPGRPKPTVVSEEVGCETVEGTAKASLRLNDGAQNLLYVGSLTTVQFRPRSVQNTPFNTEYDLLPTSVVWSVSGTKNGCKVTGRAVVNIPSFIDQPLDPTRKAWGYLNIVGKPGGDFHSIHISAFDPNARMTLTCPGNPPVIRQEPFDSVYLSKILSQTNTHVGDQIYYRGTQTLDPDRFQDSLPAPALEVLKNFPQAQAMLNRQGGKLVYTFEWDMKPRP